MTDLRTWDKVKLTLIMIAALLWFLPPMILMFFDWLEIPWRWWK